MSKYLYQNDIKERGLTEVPISELNECKKNKLTFVNDHLKATIIAANCGWYDVEYKVMRNGKCEIEFVVLWAGEKEKSGSRWINVSGNSLGAILSEVSENIF